MADERGVRRTYLATYALLLACTLLTWRVAFVDLGAWNTPAALAIASVKALLVGLFFMHLRESARLTWAVVLGALFWLGLLLVLTMGDYLTRV